MKKGNIDLTDYALIGNSRTCALVSKYGSIDWCCIPEFHSSAIFASLLDRTAGGFFSINPVYNYKSVQKYIENTNIVETHFENGEGTVRLTDGFTALEEEDKKHTLFPDHEILRIIEGISGSVNIKVEFFPRIYYGKYPAKLENHRALGIHFFYKENVYVFQSSLKPDLLKVTGEKVISVFTIKPGERFIFSLSSSGHSPAIIPEIPTIGSERMKKTIQYWKRWIGKCKYNGIFKDQVLRSALILKLLTHAPSGAIIAAPTTSLPEDPGGVRNWDYRFCWLRDASFTIRVLIKLGFYDEAHAYMYWILHATRLSRPKLQVVYTIFGNTQISEKVCDWLAGYKNSKPVRIGNSASEQFQLDVYGEVLDAVYAYSHIINEFDNDSKNFIIGLGRMICRLWDKADEGIWEIRTSSVHHTHSKVMAWAGLDRLISICDKYNWNNAPVEKFKKVRNMIYQKIEQEGFNSLLNHYTRGFGGNDVDASLLIMPMVDYCSASSPRMEATRIAIEKNLQKNFFIYRYKDIDDGLPGKEGAFIICNFWMIENLAKSGLVKEATDLFLRSVKHASPAGLLSEEIAPETGELLGNYPQGFSHIGLINAAFAIDEANNKTYGNEYR